MEQKMGFEWNCLVEGCGKTYSGSKQLTDHQGRIHKDLDPNHKFPCPHKTCDKTFACQREAYRHDGCLDRAVDRAQTGSETPVTPDAADTLEEELIDTETPETPDATIASESPAIPKVLEELKVRAVTGVREP